MSDHIADLVRPVEAIKRMMNDLLLDGNCGCIRCLAEAAVEGLREAGYQIVRHNDGSQVTQDLPNESRSDGT